MGVSAEIGTSIGSLSAARQPALAGGGPAFVLSGEETGGIVARPRLIERLLASRSTPLVLLNGPPGYSKSTSLAIWDRSDDREFCWLSCQSRHDDPAVLVEAIVEAIEPFHTFSLDVLLSLGSPDPDMNTVLNRLGREIASVENPLVLVVDDAHNLTADGTARVLETVLENLPAGSQLAIGTRSCPDLPLGAIRAKRGLLEFAATDLTMTRGESGELLRGIGLELEPGQVALIHEKTEGWPAALYLAGLAIEGQSGNLSDRVSAFSGDDRIVVDYFRDEFLKGLSPEKTDFLYRTSLLEELSGGLCDTVLERRDSARILEDLARSNSMIIPLDRSGHTYRYHHLFADMLRLELRLHDPSAEAEIHRRAARWYAAREDFKRAVGHAIESGDLGLAGDLVWTAFPELSGRGQMATMDRWFDAIGDEGIMRSPGLTLARAHKELVSGSGTTAAHWSAIAISELNGNSAYEADLLELKATLCLEGMARMESDATKAAELFDAHSAWQSPCRFFRGVAIHLAGDPEGAEIHLRDAIRIGSAMTPIIQTLALAQLSLLHGGQGRWDEASRLVAQAKEQVERCGLTQLPVMGLAFASSACIRAHQGQHEAAAADIDKTLEMMAEMVDMPAWFEAEIRISIGRAAIRLGRHELAAAMRDEAAAYVEASPGSVILEESVLELEGQLNRSPDVVAGQQLGLTKAELRTLSYLPSHHTFREIGGLLHLSQNTVKTQANSLYRKLGTNSRAGAVMIARESGLLEPERAHDGSSRSDEAKASG
ncbi:MAG: LuxR C-terminal-related transcriptional regulator [Solirubrobacterales bacterium]